MNRRFRKYELVDLTLRLPSQGITFPGDRAMEIDGPRSCVAGRTREYCYRVSFSTQIGTHVQGSHYFLENGKRIVDYALDRFEGPAFVVDCPERLIGPGTLEDQLPRPPWNSLMVVLYTGYSTALLGRWIKQGKLTMEDIADKPGLSPEAAKRLVGNGLRFLAIDAPGVEPYPSSDHATNVLLCRNDVLLLENLVGVERLPVSGAWLECFPLAVEGVEGTPCRAIAKVPPGGYVQ